MDQSLIERGIKTITSHALSYESHSVLLNKLLVPSLTPFENTVMLDADCMIAGSLSSLFSLLEGSDFAVVGETISRGNWHGQVDEVLQKFSVTAIYRFVGSFYFFSRNEVVKKVCEKALEISASYDNLAIDRIHHNLVNEEVPLSIALAVFEQQMSLRVLSETAPIKAETMFYPLRNINLLSGNSCMSACAANFGSETLEGYWPAWKMPLVVVFDSNSRLHLDYKFNAILMRLYMPIHTRKNMLSPIVRMSHAFRVVAVIGLSLFIDCYNKYKKVKQFVKRILDY